MPSPRAAIDFAQTAASALAELHRADRLVADYPTVTRLVADLSHEDLPWAGQILARLDPDELLRAHPDVPTVTIALTGHGTLAPLVPLLTAEVARHGLLPRLHAGEFDGYVRELYDPDSGLYTAGPDLVLCVLDPAIVTDELPLPWRPANVRQVAERKIHVLERLLDRFAEAGRGMLVLNTLPLPRHLTAQLVDYRSRAELGVVWREANARLLRLAGTRPEAVVVDLDPLVAEGIAAREPRLDVYAKVHLSPELLAGYARQVGHLARHVVGRTSKCLVLDLDGTVWGGTLGDDGPDGVEVAEGRHGEAFRAFQQTLVQLSSQGVLLAAVSKNDPEPVHQTLRAHPAMTLREEHFTRVTANWRPKHDNLVELAQTLNLGVDSFVFVDDSAYECGLVRRELPAVAVVPLDQEPALHTERVLRDGWFDVAELTGQDRARLASYRAELLRTDFLHSFHSLDEYLRELGVCVRFAPVTEADVARVSQLTLRTNQFNLTTRRLQPGDVHAMLRDRAARAWAIHSSDRFGDNGLVGAVFSHRGGAVLHLDNFLLSCRVFARGIEQACLSAVLRHARDNGVTTVYGTYRPTAKNATAKNFYPRYGFRPVTGDGDLAVFRHDLDDIVCPPEHVHLVANLGEDE